MSPASTPQERVLDTAYQPTEPRVCPPFAPRDAPGGPLPFPTVTVQVSGSWLSLSPVDAGVLQA